MDFTIFYSWQSDSNKKCNWNFIEDAIEKAIKRINRNVKLELAPRIDRDTKNVSGTPAIADTIAEKIRESGMLIADMTLVGTAFDDRPVKSLLWEWVKSKFSSTLMVSSFLDGKRLPNPNAAIEVGEAAEALGWDRVILVMNTFYGPADEIPFDIKHRKFPIQYKLAPDASEDERKKVKDDLVAILERAIAAAADAPHRQADKAISQLDVDCLLIISLLWRATYFRSMSQDENLKKQIGHIIDVARFHAAVQRLLDLGVIYTHVVTPSYAYHWSTLGKLVVTKLDLQKQLTGQPLDPEQVEH